MSVELQKLHSLWLTSRSHQSTTFPSISFDELTNSIVSTGPFYYYIIDFYDMSLSNISPSIYDIHGLNPATTTIHDVLNTIHPDDVDFVVNAEAFITKFFYEKLDRAQLLNYKMSFSFRSRLKNGDYALLNHQALVLTLDENGRSGKSLNIHTLIDHISPTNTYKISLMGLNGEPSYMNMSIGQNIQELPVFSKREIDIIKLIAEGLNNTQIGEKLFIATLTVKKHRQNILLKAGCKNTVHLIKNCIIQGII